MLINQDINTTFESINKDYLNTGTVSYQKAVPISSIITIIVQDTVSNTNSFGGGAIIGAGACIIPIAILGIRNPEAHYGVLFAGMAAPVMAVLGGLTSVIFPKKTRNKVYIVKDNSCVIVHE